VAPLTLARDAIYVDTTGMPVDAVVERVMAIVRGRIAKPG
jgi:cytidylate kinase